MTRYKALQSHKALVLMIMLMGFLAVLPSVSALTHITNCTDLQRMNESLSENYVLDNNIDCSDTINWNDGVGFIPIGRDTPYFTGNFSGDGFNISDLYSADDFDAITFPNNFGLFGQVVGSVISNVNLINFNIYGNNEIGVLAGEVYSSLIVNCSGTGVVTFNRSGDGYDIGGLIGYADNSLIENSYFNGNVNGNFNVGGLLGNTGNNAIISNSYFNGNVNGTGMGGGLIGFADSTKIYNSYAISNIGVENSAGGLAGNLNNGTIDNFYGTTNIFITLSQAGGFYGMNGIDAELNNSIINNSLIEGNIYYACNVSIDIGEKVGLGSFGYEENTTSNVNIDTCGVVPIPTPSPSLSGNAIYNTLSSTGAGVSIFLNFMTLSLPKLLVGLAIVGSLVLIIFVIAKFISHFALRK